MAMEVFDAVAQPKRREILRLLAGREMSAGEIASHFSVTQPAISQHLKVLKEVGLLSERREGTRRVLSVRAEGLEDLHKFLAEVLPTRMERLKRAAEQEERSERDARRAKRN
jgi:DNA-binding transcriptional ArsR family regulator